MICPYCENPDIMYSEYRALHFVRKITQSPKRYCPKCNKKWRIKLRQPSSIGREIFLVIIAGVVGFSIFFAVSRISESIKPKQQSSDLTEKLAQGKKLMDKYRQQGGNLGGAQGQDSMKEAMKYLK